MRFPDKITSYKESFLEIIPLILDELSRCDMTPTELFESLHNKASLSEYIEALDCLFALGKVELIQQREVLHYVA